MPFVSFPLLEDIHHLAPVYYNQRDIMRFSIAQSIVDMLGYQEEVESLLREALYPLLAISKRQEFQHVYPLHICGRYPEDILHQKPLFLCRYPRNLAVLRIPLLGLDPKSDEL